MTKTLHHSIQWLRSIWRIGKRNHDPFLVYSMVSFNFGGGWRELLLKACPRNA
jgi:hypothetical protein